MSILGRAWLGYVPYCDGASERRGSLLALLENGIVSITTKGKHTPRELDEIVFYANNYYEAYTIIEQLHRDKHLIYDHSQRSRAYAMKFGWDNIAAKHHTLYLDSI
jgi:hypothetical protein